MPQTIQQANGLVQGSKKMKVALMNMRYQPFYNSKQIDSGSSTGELIFTDVTETHAAYTNMKPGSFLPPPSKFDLFGVTCHLQYGVARVDFNLFYNSSALLIEIQDKIFTKIPLAEIPSGGGQSGVISTTETNTTYITNANGSQEAGSYYPVHRNGIPIRLVSNEAPTIKIAISPKSGTFSANVRVWLKLHGVFYGGVN